MIFGGKFLKTQCLGEENTVHLSEKFNKYGIKLFGTAFDMIGGGNETIIRPGYNFVDSSFCMILVRYGWIVLLAVFLIYFIVERKALKAGDRKLMVAFALISVHSAIEHHYWSWHIIH